MISDSTLGRWIDACALFAILFYVSSACAVYLIAAGGPPAFSLINLIAAVFWPFTVVWWALNWIGAAIAVYLMFLGLQRVVERR